MVWLAQLVIPDSVAATPARTFALSWDAITALSSAALVLTGLGAIVFAWRQLTAQRDISRVDNLEKQVSYFESEHFLKFRYYDDFVWLISELQRIQTERNGQPDIPSDEDLFYFYKDEASDLGASPRASAKRRKPSSKMKATENTQAKISLSS